MIANDSAVQKKTGVTAIIVTHNSASCLESCLEKLRKQTEPPDEIILVDSGSTEKGYLDSSLNEADTRLFLADNIGFSRANNLGYAKRDRKNSFILFLNPDAFLPETFIEQASEIMSEHPQTGLLSGRLLGYDIHKNEPTGMLDSTGIFQKKYGRWYDRGNGQVDRGQYREVEEVPALCGALLFCRAKALAPFGAEVFDSDFFLYKEDIELCLRIRKAGWRILYAPELWAYHGRGWQARKTMSFFLKKTAAQSEILLYKKHPSPYIIWAYVKLWLVLLLRL